MDEKLNRVLTELRFGYQALYADRLVNLVLFGSQARGDAIAECPARRDASVTQEQRAIVLTAKRSLKAARLLQSDGLEATKLRHKGDYAHGQDVTKEQSAEQITHAEQFLRVAEGLLGSPDAVEEPS